MALDPLMETVLGYYPTLGLSVTAVILFSLAGLVTAYLCYAHHRSGYTWLCIIPLTSLVEVVGYIFRIVFANNPTIGTYVGFDLLVLVSPNALAAVNYKILGKLLQVSGHSAMGLKPKSIAKVFVASDVFAFVSQLAGGGLSASGGDEAAAQGITMVGLAVQLVFLAGFLYLVHHAQTKPAYGFCTPAHITEKSPLQASTQSVFTCLYVTTGLLYVRSIYRMAEYGAGYTGPIAHSEAAFYVFDGLLILSMFVTYCCIWFTKYMPQAGVVVKPQVLPMHHVEIEVPNTY